MSPYAEKRGRGPSIRSKCCVPRPGHRRESFFAHNPADAHDALPPGSLNPSKHSVEVEREF